MTQTPKLESASVTQSSKYQRYNVRRINCTGKEELRRRIGSTMKIDTKGKLMCVTNPDETFHAAIKTEKQNNHPDTLPTLIYVI